MMKINELVEELIRFRPAQSEETRNFTWKHQKLCDTLQEKLESLGDAYLKYDHISYITQGIRDQGVDVLLKIALPDTPESYIGFQVKSYNELDNRNFDLSKSLKAALHDAKYHYDQGLKRYYIMLCGDSELHSKRISAISAEFSKEPRTRVILPTYFFSFLTMPEAELVAIVDRYLRSDDFVRKRAWHEVRGFQSWQIFALLACLTWSYENGSDYLPEDFLEQSGRIQDLEYEYGPEILNQLLGFLDGTALELRHAPSKTQVRSDEFPAIRALYYDLKVRYELDDSDLFHYLYNFLKV